MKKAKIMFTAILALSVVGGVFAFQAKKQPNVVYLCPAVGQPTTTSIAGTLTDVGTPAIATSISTATCVQTFTIGE